MFSEALKIADRNTVKYMIEELQDKATHEAELRKQTEENLQQETQRRKQAEENQKQTEENLQQETQRRKQAEEKQKQAEADFRHSQEENARLKALLEKNNISNIYQK